MGLLLLMIVSNIVFAFLANKSDEISVNTCQKPARRR
jgi:hypothetical protein